MTRSQRPGCVLLVEGVDDKKLYEKFADPIACSVLVVHGRPNVVDTLAILEKDSFPGVLGIVDADFSVLEQEDLPSPNLLRTDTHDLETMLLESPALDHVLRERGEEEKLESFRAVKGANVRPRLLELGRPLGYLRWLSHREQLSLRFEGLPFTDFVDHESWSLDEGKLLVTVERHSRHRPIKEPLSSSKVNALKNPEHNPWHVCCGHDLVELLSIGLRRALGSHPPADVKSSRLEESLRLAYEQAYFERTQLWASIRAWETSNSPYIVLRVRASA